MISSQSLKTITPQASHGGLNSSASMASVMGGPQQPQPNLLTLNMMASPAPLQPQPPQQQ
jgi:hypothetical protein